MPRKRKITLALRELLPYPSTPLREAISLSSAWMGRVYNNYATYATYTTYTTTGGGPAVYYIPTWENNTYRISTNSGCETNT